MKHQINFSTRSWNIVCQVIPLLTQNSWTSTELGLEMTPTRESWENCNWSAWCLPEWSAGNGCNENKANLRDLIAATGLVILLKFDPNRRFFSPCDLEIWRMTLKNNREPLLSSIKLCASFHHHVWIQTVVTVRKRLSWVLTTVTLTFDLWPWPFAWTSLLSLVITPENFMMIRWWEHSQKGVTDRRTDWTIHRAAWSQLKIYVWWRHQMEAFSALLALSLVTGVFPSQRPVTRSFGVFFDLRLNKRLNKKSRCRWFEMPSLSLWRNGM